MMKTGFGLPSDTNAQSEQMVESILNIVVPVIEKSMLLACEYSKACGRDVVLAQDLEYASKYCVMHTVGQDLGSVLEDTDEDVEDLEVVDEEDIPFERYSGSDPKFLKVNEAYDAWDSWTPTNPSEQILKNAIDSNGRIG